MFYLCPLAIVVLLATSVDPRSLPYCTKTQIPDLLIEEGVIHIVYSMKSRCRQCYSLAVMLPILKNQLAISERIDIKLIVAMDKVEGNGKEKGLISYGDMKIDTTGEIYRSLGKNNGYIFIIDRCRRLTYRIVPEHAMKFKPYVWATLLSTFISNPCGQCHFTLLEQSSHEIRVEETSKKVDTSQPPSNVGSDSLSPTAENATKEKEETQGEIEFVEFLLNKQKEKQIAENKVENVVTNFFSFLKAVFETKEEMEKQSISSESSSQEGVEPSIEGSNEASDEKEKLRNHYNKLIPWIYIASEY
ncbi:uncharacterized protein LOC106674323 [Cimex lectularius]|uniref:Selenoprotein P N-terminal domain-containing protein n=1 Tax=Cimex lectularius TaxID=79782 RepID=A0A8I6SB52_CIMLE|nr:uncharacterized protein LOC106674323 [Cimex lectularius]